jgi:hypothetical protein
MIYAGFCGPSNPSQSVEADCERLINWYVERVESPFAPTGAALYPTPGQQAHFTTPQVGTRAIWSQAGRAFAVIGSRIYEFFQNQTYIDRGIVAIDQYPATISYNGAAGGQLFITSGGNGYCYALATNVLTQVLTGEATQGGMINARFLAFNVTNGRVRMSNLNDGLTWDPTLFFQRTLAPDPWQTMLIRAPEIWLIGEQTGEVWYDAGVFPVPYQPIPGAFFRYGTEAPFSAAIAGDTVVWLSRSATGGHSIVAARGYTPQPISNYAVETAIAGYQRTATISDAETLIYEDQGHLWAVFSCPQARGTWVVDMATSLWHERGTWNAAANRFDAWAPRIYGSAFGKHLVGARGTGTVSSMDVLYGTEAGGGILRRVRVAPPLWASSKQRLIVSRLQVRVETGLGLPVGQGSDPQVMLRTSQDGKTWGSERMASAGKIGEYALRCAWTRLGSSDKLWVPEISVSDPIPWRIAGAELDGSGFQQAQAAA